jgi:ferritin-like metal-binding protein YciE/nucleoside-diphosphate-sugar epimerase
MKVVVVGATGNVGTSVVEALGASSEVEEIVGLARRRPAWSPPKTRWVEADVVGSDLTETFEGADAVVHLAWAIQPSHDAQTLERINIDGSRRVFEAVAEAGVGRLVHASSIGAYSAGPKDRPVDESWPVDGTPSSFYSRHKAAVEKMLDRFESENPGIAVVRLRPGLIFRGEAANEIRRLFIGPFLPNFLIKPGLIPVLPRLADLRVQAVHSADVGQAYLLGVLADVSGAFNIAAEPPLDSERLAALLGAARTFPVPTGLVRGLAAASWRLRLQPTSPGWLDMAMNVPLMDTGRARRVLGWSPDHTALEAVEELLEGMREGDGHRTPPLEGDSVSGRIDEVRTGVGGRQQVRDRETQLLKYLTDVHSIEEQALVQMRAAPKIAGDPRLSEIFEDHLAETEIQERRVRERIEGLGSDLSRLKDLAGSAGGRGMVLFARSQPDTPGKLVAHAYSYEHMEAAAYELLRHLAERAGDEATAQMAEEIAAEERRMGERLAECFDVAVGASLAGVAPGDLPGQLAAYLRDAHAIEQQAVEVLEAAVGQADDEQLARVLRGHLEETRGHLERIEATLASRGSGSSALKDGALKLGGLNLGAFFGAQPDTTTKLAGFVYAFEHLEIAAHELLKRVAERVGDEEAARVAEEILVEERGAARAIEATWERPGVPLGVAE